MNQVTINNGSAPTERAPARSEFPIVGISAVLIGAFIVTLNTSITALGLADLRGAVHAGFDEGAWIPTAHTMGQMLICAPTVWAGLTFGPRRVLLLSSFVVTCISVVLPFSQTLSAVILLQFISGLAMGTFIPLTFMFVARNLPLQYRILGVAAYAMNTEMSQNIAASVEGFYLDYASWQWIFWQNAGLGVVMFCLVSIGMPKRKIERVPWADVDLSGMLFYSLGLCALYAALDQGNRLDWLSSGLINGLLLCSLTLIVAFSVHSLTAKKPFLDLRHLVTSNVALLAMMLTFLRFAILATAFLIPQFLTNIQGYRALQIGDVLLFIALPQLILAPMIAFLLGFTDPRVTAAFGFAAVGFACIWTSAGLTPEWASEDFMPAQILQAVGQSFAFTSLVTYNLRFIKPAQVLAFATILQTARLMGGEFGIAFVGTFVRVREQLHSNLLGLHVVDGAGTLESFMDRILSALAKFGPGTARLRGIYEAAAAARKQALSLAYIDAFLLLGISMGICLLFMMLLGSPPKPPATGAPAGGSLLSRGLAEKSRAVWVGIDAFARRSMRWRVERLRELRGS